MRCFPFWEFTTRLLWVGNFAIVACFATQPFSFVLVSTDWATRAATCGTRGVAKGTEIATGAGGCSSGIGRLSFFALLAAGEICITGRSFPTDGAERTPYSEAKPARTAGLADGVALAVGVLAGRAGFARVLFGGTGVGVFVALDALELFLLGLVFSGNAIEAGCHSLRWLAASLDAVFANGFLRYFGRCSTYFTLQACTLFCFCLVLSWDTI